MFEKYLEKLCLLPYFSEFMLLQTMVHCKKTPTPKCWKERVQLSALVTLDQLLSHGGQYEKCFQDTV